MCPSSTLIATTDATQGSRNPELQSVGEVPDDESGHRRVIAMTSPQVTLSLRMFVVPGVLDSTADVRLRRASDTDGAAPRPAQRQRLVQGALSEVRGVGRRGIEGPRACPRCRRVERRRGEHRLAMISSFAQVKGHI